MKKQIHFLFALVLLTLSYTHLHAQSYTASTTTQTYTDLVGATSINGSATWDDPAGTFPLGFDFTLFDTTINTIYLDENGLGGELVPNSTYEGVSPNIFVYGADIMDRGYNFENEDEPTGSLSTISYKTEGSVGTRICKIEWKNIGFYGDIDDDGVSTDFANVQLWLYEGSNKVEFRYGPQSVSNIGTSLEGETGIIVGLLTGYNYDTDEPEGDAFILAGDPADPTLVITTQNIFSNTLTGVPTDGTVYTFSPSAISSVADRRNTSSTRIYPNPATSIVHIQTDLTSYTLQLTDILGNEITTAANSPETLDITGIKNGIYLLTLSGNGKKITQRIVKQ